MVKTSFLVEVTFKPLPFRTATVYKDLHYLIVQSTISHLDKVKFLQEKCLSFSFSKIKRENILQEILKLEASKTCQDTDIPTKIIKENADIFADILLASFNDSVEKSNFHHS